MYPATVAQRQLHNSLDGSFQQCWVVTGHEPEGDAVTLFSGHDAASRAIAYARSRYAPCHFRMTAEPGSYKSRGARALADSLDEGSA